MVDRAWRVVAEIRQGDPSVESAPAFTQLIRNTLKAQGHKTDGLEETQDVIPAVYNPGLLNSDIDLSALAENMATHPACRICFHGPPGTGKTTFGHWLARRLDKPILEKKASDLISPYLGMTERHLAEAFAEAREESAILMIDEVDSFLQERGQAQRSWEVSQVNEMLCQMERFNGIFIASTNLMDGLDQAALRRFDLKVCFDFLRGEQTVALFKRHCKNLKIGNPGTTALKSAAILANTTPGDFANVARQHRFRGFTSPDAFIDAVARECAMKKGTGGRKLGFGGSGQNEF